MTSKRSTKAHVADTNADDLYCSKLAAKQHLSAFELAKIEQFDFRVRFDFFIKRAVAMRSVFCLEDEDGIFLASNGPDHGIIPLWASYEHACIMQRLSNAEAWKTCWVGDISLNRFLKLARELDLNGDSFVIFPLAMEPGAQTAAKNLLNCLQSEMKATR